ISALRKVGIEDFSCDIGHVGIFQGMMDSMGYPDPLQEQLKTIVKRKDFIDLDYFLTLHPPEELPMHSLLEEFPYLRGKKELLGEFQKKISPNRRFQEAFERLSRIWDILADFGLEKYLFINLGLIRDFDYYSGVIFEGFSPFSGSPLLTGGRYDELFGVFGKDHPACGFALFAEILIEVLQQSGPVKDDREKTIILSYHPSLRGEVFSLSQDLRSMGMMVLISEDSGGEELLRVTLNGRLIFTGIPEWIALRETIKKEITNG
ncbi:MAG: ATP phosphoribosyltransferase regulatory subunit, partial [Atribacterota bacterium]